MADYSNSPEAPPLLPLIWDKLKRHVSEDASCCLSITLIITAFQFSSSVTQRQKGGAQSRFLPRTLAQRTQELLDSCRGRERTLCRNQFGTNTSRLGGAAPTHSPPAADGPQHHIVTPARLQWGVERPPVVAAVPHREVDLRPDPPQVQLGGQVLQRRRAGAVEEHGAHDRKHKHLVHTGAGR